MHMIGKDGSTALFGRCRQLFLQVMTVEDVVAQHQRTGSGADELFTQNKGLSQPSGLGWTLYCKFRPHWLPSPSSCSKREYLAAC